MTRNIIRYLFTVHGMCIQWFFIIFYYRNNATKWIDGMSKDKIILKSFSFTDEEPDLSPRTPFYWMSEDELLSIKTYPYISRKKCPFSAELEINGEPLTLRGVIPKGFCYNVANILWILEPIIYDKHSPFVKDASFIHDYLISHKKDLYEYWELKSKGVTPAEFRKITTLIFCHRLKENAVSYGKAQIISFFVDLWQSILPAWRTLDKVETEL